LVGQMMSFFCVDDCVQVHWSQRCLSKVLLKDAC
jgi:hypothetical protein